MTQREGHATQPSQDTIQKGTLRDERSKDGEGGKQEGEWKEVETCNVTKRKN